MRKKSKDPSLMYAWRKRARLREKADAIYKEGNKLIRRADRLNTEVRKLTTEGYKLFALDVKILSEADKLWIAAVVKRYGKKARIEWGDDSTCTVKGVTYQ